MVVCLASVSDFILDFKGWGSAHCLVSANVGF